MERRVSWVCIGLSVLLGWLVLRVFSDWRLVWAKRIAKGISVKPEHLAQTMGWWTLLGCSLLCLLLGLTVRRWLGRLSPMPCPLTSSQTSPASRSRWLWWGGLALVLLAATGLRYPRMQLSLYNDEVYGFEKYVSGRFTQEPGSGDLTFKPISWQETWWSNRLGNNFPLYSACGRWCHETWARFTHAAEGQISEWALRSPALAGGLISIALLALWLRGAGLPRAGLVCALVLALHPAHIRYSTEARGYGMAFAGVILVAWLLWRAMREDRWIFWAGFGLAQVALLLSYPGAIYWVAVVNLTVGGWLALLTLWKSSTEVEPQRARQMLARWVVVNAGAATLFCLLCMPQIYQAQLAHADPNYMRAPLPSDWWYDVSAFLLWGLRWSGGDATLPHMPALTQWPMTAAVLALGVPLLAWVGLLLRRRRRGTLCWLLALSVPASVALAWVHNASRGVFVHYWYAVHLVPLLVLFSVLAWVVLRPDSKSQSRAISGFLGKAWQGIGVIFLVAWLCSALLHWRIIGFHSKEPLRSVIESTRGEVYPHYLKGEHPKILLGAFYSNANTYDPHLIVIKTPQDLEHLVEQAKSEALPLYISHGYLPQAKLAYPELIEMLYESGRFRLVKRWDGLGGNQFAHFVLEWVNNES